MKRPMPQVVIEEAPNLTVSIQSIKLTAARNGSDIPKVADVYLNRQGHTALVDCVLVEEGRPQSFFVQLSQKDRQITVRLLPATDPADVSARRGPLLRTPAEGADTLVWYAADDGAPLKECGRFWLDRRPRPLHPLASTRRSHTPEERERLWSWAVRKSGLVI